MSKLKAIPDQFRVDVSIPHSEFKKHLDVDNKILFSGAFGSGKTYFLDDFFKKEEISKEYFPLHLFPVNYSVSRNEDIYKLIKYDIISIILEDEKFKPEKVELPISWVAYQAFQKSIGRLIQGISKVSTKMKIIEGIAKAASKFEESYKKIKTIPSDKDILEEYQSSFAQLYENELINSIIYQGLKQIAEDKKIILLIDDLDRIDPGHIFRILNIFSSQIDIFHEKNNKKLFDKVILVCDIENLKKIYHHKYGKDTDFNGYINKFYETEVFHFKLGYAIISAIINAINRYIEKDGFYTNERGLIQDILFSMNNADTMDIRNLRKLIDGKFELPPSIELSPRNSDKTIQSYSLKLYPIYKLLLFIFNDSKDLIQKLEKTAEYRRFDGTNHKGSQDMTIFELYLLPAIALGMFKLVPNVNYPYSIAGGTITFLLTEDNKGFQTIYNTQVSDKKKEVNIFDELVKAIKVLDMLKKN